MIDQIIKRSRYMQSMYVFPTVVRHFFVVFVLLRENIPVLFLKSQKTPRSSSGRIFSPSHVGRTTTPSWQRKKKSKDMMWLFVGSLLLFTPPLLPISCRVLSPPISRFIKLFASLPTNQSRSLPFLIFHPTFSFYIFVFVTFFALVGFSPPCHRC